MNKTANSLITLIKNKNIKIGFILANPNSL
jgi:hypothetical protein